MPSVICQVVNKKGMHARAAAKIVELVSGYDCEVSLTHQQTTAAGNSLLKLLTLNAPKGSQVTINAEGKNCSKLLKELSALFQQGFGE